MFKTLVVLFVAALAVAILAGCAGGGAEIGTQPIEVQAFYYRPGPVVELPRDPSSTEYVVEVRYAFRLQVAGEEESNDLQCVVVAGAENLTQYGENGHWFSGRTPGTATIRCTNASGSGVVRIQIN